MDREWQRGPIISVEFHMDGGFGGRWNADLGHPNFATASRMPPVLPERALDDAVLSANEFRDMQPLMRLREHRDRRNRIIEDHFRMCARRLIEDIEKTEGWAEWMPRLSPSERREGE